MPLNSTRGAGSAKGFGFTAGASILICATGGTILTCGDFKTHVFTGPGTFTVSKAVPTATVEYLVVAGGGGGGGFAGGGGGAGGFRQNFPSPTGLPVSAQGYPITVGSGGAGVSANTPLTSQGTATTPGSNSIFSTITSAGGGFGATNDEPPGPPNAGGRGADSGGSGGGGSRIFSPRNYGLGNTPPTSPSQGSDGGSGTNAPYNGGGGGGAGGVGGNSPGPVAGEGGVGSPIATTFFGPTSPSYGTPGPAPGRYFAGGGGGAANGGGGGGAGNSGGGGAGGNSQTTNSVAGTINTGGGGGGAGGAPTLGQDVGNSGAGGSGIVVVRYQFK